MTDPLERIVAGPVEEDFGATELRVDSDDTARTITVYVLRPGTNVAASQLVLGFEQALELARFIIEAAGDAPPEPHAGKTIDAWLP